MEQIVRQSEHKLIKAVRDTGTGIVSEEIEQFLEALSGDIPEESGTTVHLFSKNIEAAIYNEKKLNEIPGEEKVFMSWCLNFFCAVGALCMFSYFLVKLR